MRKALDIDLRYSVDTEGNVYGVKGQKLKPWKACKGKYLQVAIRGCKFYVHRLIAGTFIPNPDELPVVAHGDNNGLNNGVGNLRWATHAENVADKRIHGTHQQGEQCPNAKLSDADVLRIRELKADEHWHVDKIAAEYGVSRWTIYDACNLKRRLLADA